MSAPIRPVCFLSPHYEAERGATAFSHFKVYTVVTTVGDKRETCKSQREKAGILEEVVGKCGLKLQTVFAL